MSKYFDNELLRRKIDLLPDKPGSYQMKDKDGTIIYVGKAKSLVKRVKQYFTRPQEGKVLRMVNEIEDFSIIETQSEKEAFLLEINLIHKYYPKYNVLLKDGKMYPYISLKKNNDPFLKVSYNDKDKNFYHYGPFPSTNSCYKMIDLLNKLFPLRKCKTIPSKPCLYYYLGQCLAPCINKVNEENYKEIDGKIKSFLNGDTSEIVHDLTNKMKEASQSFEFEKAKEYKILIDSINHIVEKQSIMSTDHTSRDVIGYSIRDGYVGFTFLLYRSGKLLGKQVYVTQFMETIENTLEEVVGQYYTNENHSKPSEILVPNKDICPFLEELLDIKVLSPTRGVKREMINIALENARQSLDEHFLTARLNDDNLVLLEQLQKMLYMDKLPQNIELYDNSHLQGSDAVGVMVKYINGEPSKKHYRKYHIKGENTKDDLSSMYEVVSRRINRLIEDDFNSKPDLIICDGGDNQIQIVNEVLSKYKDYNLNIKVAGLSKNDKHETNALIDGETGEVIPLDKKSPLFFMLVRMQDEVHRYAITFFRKSHSKSLFASFYDDVKDVGVKKRRQLIDAFPTIESLKNASFEDLKNLVGEKAAKNIIEKLDNFE